MASKIQILKGRIKEHEDHSHNMQRETKHLRKELAPQIYRVNSTAEVLVGLRKEYHHEDKEEESMDQRYTHLQQRDDSACQPTALTKKCGNPSAKN